jgi:hypothetical protein
MDEWEELKMNGMGMSLAACYLADVLGWTWGVSPLCWVSGQAPAQPPSRPGSSHRCRPRVPGG